MKFNIIIYKDDELYEPFWFVSYIADILISHWDGEGKLDDFEEKDLIKVFYAINKELGKFDKMEIISI